MFEAKMGARRLKSHGWRLFVMANVIETFFLCCLLAIDNEIKKLICLRKIDALICIYYIDNTYI
jgi:hypothetical protein